MTTGKLLLGVLAGLAAGALVGVLLAPEKGSDTRKKISKGKEDLTDLLKEKFNSFLDTVSEKFEKVTEDVSDFAEQAQAKSEEVKKDLKTSKN